MPYSCIIICYLIHNKDCPFERHAKGIFIVIDTHLKCSAPDKQLT